MALFIGSSYREDDNNYVEYTPQSTIKLLKDIRNHFKQKGQTVGNRKILLDRIDRELKQLK